MSGECQNERCLFGVRFGHDKRDRVLKKYLRTAMLVATVVLSVVAMSMIFAGTGAADDGLDPAPEPELAFDYDPQTDTVTVVHDGGGDLTPNNTDAMGFEGNFGLEEDQLTWLVDSTEDGTEIALEESVSEGEAIAEITGVTEDQELTFI